MNTIELKVFAETVEEVKYVNTINGAVNANYAEGEVFVYIRRLSLSVAFAILMDTSAA